jgi:hypothetical protein
LIIFGMGNQDRTGKPLLGDELAVKSVMVTLAVLGARTSTATVISRPPGRGSDTIEQI